MSIPLAAFHICLVKLVGVCICSLVYCGREFRLKARSAAHDQLSERDETIYPDVYK